MNKLAVTGFSRWGKGALLAGLLDERFKVTHAGASGSGGAAPYRFMPFGHEYTWGEHERARKYSVITCVTRLTTPTK